MADPKIEWVRIVLGVDLERFGKGTATPQAPADEDLLASLLPLAPGEVGAFPGWDFDGGRVYADTPKPPKPPGDPKVPDPKVPDPKMMDPKMLEIVAALDATKPDGQKADNILPATPTLTKLIKPYTEAKKALGAKLKAKDFAGAAVAIPPVKAAMKALLKEADAQDKVAVPKANAAEKTVKDLMSKNALAAKTNAEKVELLRKLQGSATKKPEFRKAQREIYKTLKLDQTFLNEDAKKRDQVVKSLVGTAKDKAELKEKRDKWGTLSEDAKLAMLRKVLEVHSKTFGIPVPEIVSEHQSTKVSDTGDETVINGQYYFEDGKIHIIFNTDPRNKMHDFDKALGLIIHESLHHYQHELVKKLESGKLTKKDPEYEQALLFQINMGMGVVPIDEDPDVYKKQPLEEHSWLRGPETAQMILDAL